jgi:GGDEF domain-containing protein
MTNVRETPTSGLIRQLTRTDGISYIHEVLEATAKHYGLEDAVIRLEGLPGDGFFRLHRAQVDFELASRVPPGPRVLFTEPDVVPKDVAETILHLCQLGLRLCVSRHFRHLDLPTGLLAPRSFDDVLKSSTAQAARHGWVFTLVVVDLDGPTGEPSVDDARRFGQALRRSLRSGDVGARLEARRFSALLTNADLDAVNPLLGRVYEQLGSSRTTVRLSVGSAATPTETVDPVELRRLAISRLQPGTREHPVGAPGLSASLWEYLELQLRLLPPVVHVSRNGHDAAREMITILTRGPSPTVEASARRIVDAHGLEVELEFEELNATDDRAAESVEQPREKAHEEPRPQPPRKGLVRSDSISGGSRITYKSAIVESPVVTVVHLAHRDRLGVGRSSAGELRGSAEATMVALSELGLESPLTLASVSTAARQIPGTPVRVVLTDVGSGSEYVGIARGQTGAEAASRATLSALNGFLDEASEKLSA